MKGDVIANEVKQSPVLSKGIASLLTTAHDDRGAIASAVKKSPTARGLLRRRWRLAIAMGSCRENMMHYEHIFTMNSGVYNKGRTYDVLLHHSPLHA